MRSAERLQVDGLHGDAHAEAQILRHDVRAGVERSALQGEHGRPYLKTAHGRELEPSRCAPFALPSVLEEPELAQLHVDVVEANRPERVDLLLRGRGRRGHLEEGRAGKARDGRVGREARLHAQRVVHPVDEAEGHALAAHVVAVERPPQQGWEVDVHPGVANGEVELDVLILHAQGEIGHVDPARDHRVGEPVRQEQGVRVRADCPPHHPRPEGQVGGEEIDDLEDNQGKRRDPRNPQRLSSHVVGLSHLLSCVARLEWEAGLWG
jgi:hypothetical protein